MDRDFKIGSYTVKPSQCIICDESGNRAIEPKAMKLLLALANAKGQLVSRSDLVQIIWEQQIVTDYALNTLIASLRKSLGDQADSPRFIETRPKLGYRLIPTVEPVDSANIEKKSASHEKTRFGLPFMVLLSSFAAILLIILTNLTDSSIFGSQITPVIEETANRSMSGKQSGQVKQNGEIFENNNQVIIQHRYISRVNISVDTSELNDAGVPICINTDADFFTKLIYSNNKWSMKDYKWTLYSDFYDLDFNHTQQGLAGLSEQHDIEHGHPYGVVKEKMAISFDEIEDFTGSSNWSVYSFEDKLLCTGSALFIARKI